MQHTSFELLADSVGFIRVTNSPCFPKSTAESQRAQFRRLKKFLQKSTAGLSRNSAQICGYSPEELLMSWQLRPSQC